MFLNNLYDFQIAMRIYTLADKHKSQVNHSLAQKQKYFLPNIFTKYFPGGVTSAVLCWPWPVTGHWTVKEKSSGQMGAGLIGGHQAGRSQGVSHEPPQALYCHDQETFRQQMIKINVPSIRMHIDFFFTSKFSRPPTFSSSHSQPPASYSSPHYRPPVSPLWPTPFYGER